MRQPRLKIDALLGPSVHHCISRTVNGEFLLDGVAKEVLRKILWQVAAGCGVEILAYIILCNHFHVEVLIPKRVELTDEELLRRYAILYPKPSRHQTRRLDVVRAQLAINGPEAIKWRAKMLRLMNDVSQFMKLVKQRFTIWFNRTHDRFGTLWAERFKSVLAENQPRVLRILSAYIDLNCVRAGVALDPKDYRFCSYAEAVAGRTEARRGIMLSTGCETWEKAQAAYRCLLYSIGGAPRENGASFRSEDVKRVMRDGGRLALPIVLRCRLRHLSDGAILGCTAFVDGQLAGYRARTNREQAGARAHPMPIIADWGDLATLRSLRGEAVG